MNVILKALCAIGVALASQLVAAQAYPSKPVRIIVNYPPGGPTDLVARTVGAKMGEILGQSFVIENLPGANGAIGTLNAARSAPDGYTLLFGTSGHTSIVAALYAERLPFDPFKDITPISLLVNSTQAIVAHPSLNVKTIADLVTLAKAKPGQLNYGSVGIGSGNHLGIELLKSMAKIDMVHVPYKGTAQVMLDLLAGRVQLMLNSVATVLPAIKSGKLVALAVGSKARSYAIPDVPTMIEAGFPGYDVSTWFALFAPAKTPAAIIDRLNAATNQALVDPRLAKTLASAGADPTGSTPDYLAKLMRDEYERWRKVIAEAKIVVD